jgi:hypothetical protein
MRARTLNYCAFGAGDLAEYAEEKEIGPQMTPMDADDVKF